MITVAAAGTLTLATVVSVAGVTPSASTAGAGTTDAYLTSVNGNTATGRAADLAGRSSIAQQMVSLSKTKADATGADAAKAAKATAAADAAVKTRAHSVSPSGTPRQIAKQMLGQFGWSSSQFSCLNPLWQHESGWSVTADNAGSGAYGIPQALPGSQMASAGGDWRTNAATQIKWGLTYIQGRYGSPCGASAHEHADNWY